MTPRRAAGYGEDLAHIHDAGFGEFSARAARGLLGLLKQGGALRGLVLDLGCGSGIWARELSRAGYDVIGVDISRSMIALARARAPRARFRRASFLDMKLPRCEAITAIGECFNYGFDDRVGPGSLAGFFLRIHGALRPGGLVIFDARMRERTVRSVLTSHREGRDWAVLVKTVNEPGGRHLTRHITTFRRVGRLYRRGEETHRIRLYGKTEIATMLRRAGFRVRHLRGYGRIRFEGSLAGFLARKP